MLATLFIPTNVSIRVAALYGFFGGVLGLLLLLAIVYITHLILAFKKQRDETRTLYRPIEELAHIKPGDVVRKKDINVSLMFQQLRSDTLSNVTFEHCVLRGPCTIAIKGNEFNSCNHTGRGNFSDRLIKAEVTRPYGGIGLFVHCKFNFCEFANLSFLLPEDAMKEFLDKVVQI